MPVIVVANPKGGVGKSTFATNLAGYFASCGHRVMLGDADPQQSSLSWLSLRSPLLPPIASWEVERGTMAKAPKGTTHIVLDTPAGLDGHRFDEVMRIADKVVVPLQASMFDILATQAFLQRVQARRPKVSAGVLGMRLNQRTRAAEQLAHYVGSTGMPVLGGLRDTQNYVQLAAHGTTLWDVARSRVERDLAQWEPILAWIEAK